MPRSPELDDGKIVSYLREWPQSDVYPSTGTVKDHLTDEFDVDYDRKTVYRRLNSLAEEGEIQRLEVGEGRGKSVGWYVQDASESLSDADQIAQAVVEHLDGASLRLDASERKRLAEDVAEELRQ